MPLANDLVADLGPWRREASLSDAHVKTGESSSCSALADKCSKKVNRKTVAAWPADGEDTGAPVISMAGAARHTPHPDRLMLVRQAKRLWCRPSCEEESR